MEISLGTFEFSTRSQRQQPHTDTGAELCEQRDEHTKTCGCAQFLGNVLHVQNRVEGAKCMQQCFSTEIEAPM